MQIKIAARHGHLSDEAQGLIRAKAEKLLQFFDRITFIEVMVDLHDGPVDRVAEIKVDAEHKHDFVAKDQAPDVMVAVDMAVDRIKHQIHKYKEKIQAHRPH